jgi:hypothetical protein
MKLYLFILWTRAKYKKSIFYFWKLTRLLHHVACLGLEIQLAICFISVSLWGKSFSWVDILDPLTISWLFILLPFVIYSICGIVINYKKTKKMNSWYRFTSTQSIWIRNYRHFGWI